MASEGVIAETKEALWQRLKSPYAASYVLAWCAVNYQLLIVVFSSGDYTEKIGYITKTLRFGQSVWGAFGVPALLAFLPFLALPVLNQLAELWSKGVVIVGANLSMWMDTRKRKSDPELIDLARSRSFDVDAMRSYSKDLYRDYAALVLKRVVKSNLGREDWVKLSGAHSISNAVKQELVTMAETVGFPNTGYKMLKALQNNEVQTEEQLLSHGASSETPQDRREVVALLNAIELIELKWTEGLRPNFKLTAAGGRLLKFIVNEHSAAFTS